MSTFIFAFNVRLFIYWEIYSKSIFIEADKTKQGNNLTKEKITS